LRCRKHFTKFADLRTHVVAKAHAHELQDDLCVLVHGCLTEVLEALRGGAQSFHAQLCTFPTRRRWADRGCHELCVTSRLGDHASIQYSTPFTFSTSFCHRSQSLALSSCAANLVSCCNSNADALSSRFFAPRSKSFFSLVQSSQLDFCNHLSFLYGQTIMAKQ